MATKKQKLAVPSAMSNIEDSVAAVEAALKQMNSLTLENFHQGILHLIVQMAGQTDDWISVPNEVEVLDQCKHWKPARAMNTPLFA